MSPATRIALVTGAALEPASDRAVGTAGEAAAVA
jgi:hypothetical protein